MEDRPAHTGRVWMTGEDVAREYDLSPHTVKAWRYRGQGPPFYRMHRAIRYRRSEVEEWHRRTRREGAGMVPA